MATRSDDRSAWDSAAAEAQAALARADPVAAHPALAELRALARSTEEQVVAQHLLGEALLHDGQVATARAALHCALALGVDLPPGHGAIAGVEAALARSAPRPAGS